MRVLTHSYRSMAKIIPGSFSVDFNNLLGYGSFGVVYNGEFDGTPVAYKSISKNNHKTNSASIHDCFTNEVYINKNIAGIPHCCKCLGWSEDDYHWILVFELVDTDLFTMRNILTFSQKVYIIYQIVSALKCLHENGIIHRDIKLENVLMKGTTHALICDFGSAMESHENMDTKIDCYGLGTLIFLLFEGYHYTPPHPPVYECIKDSGHMINLINNLVSLVKADRWSMINVQLYMEKHFSDIIDENSLNPKETGSRKWTNDENDENDENNPNKKNKKNNQPNVHKL